MGGRRTAASAEGGEEERRKVAAAAAAARAAALALEAESRPCSFPAMEAACEFCLKREEDLDGARRGERMS